MRFDYKMKPGVVTADQWLNVIAALGLVRADGTPLTETELPAQHLKVHRADFPPIVLHFIFMQNFREFEAGPDPFGRMWSVQFKWLQTAISLRHSDSIDVKFHPQKRRY
jgi:hypothetical protein